MEIFCRNIPQQVKDKHLSREFKPVLKQFGIPIFHCRKAGRTNAIITIPDAQKAQKVLDLYGQDNQRTRKPAKQLKMFDRPIYLVEGKSKPDEFLLRSLVDGHEGSRRAEHRHNEPTTGQHPASFFIVDICCGVWSYTKDGRPVFVDCFRLTLPGKIVFGKTTLRVYVEDKSTNADYQIEFSYSTLSDTIHLGTLESPSITINDSLAPRFYVSDAGDKMAAQMASLLNKKPKQLPQKRRVTSLGGGHDEISGICFTYRFCLRDRHDIFTVRSLGAAHHIPTMNRWMDRKALFEHYASTLNQYLFYIRGQKIPYCIKFQMEALVWNGQLSPTKALSFYPHVIQFLQRERTDVVEQGIMRMHRHIESPSPDVDPADVGMSALAELLHECVENAARDLKSTAGLRPAHSNNVFVYKAQVTPCGIYLTGPHTETKNRVLRRYPDYIDYFLRVEFGDENGERVHFDPTASLNDIFHGRFKKVLTHGIEIGGRGFAFLGFSHSSLRSQACWFVAPFQTSSGQRLTAQSIVLQLGHFQDIRSPAKQAARIGQAFSETLTSISVSHDCLHTNAPDVERNGRVFSDGVGTMSLSIMYKVWNEYALREKVKPTVFQVRIGGAKGMVSLDTRIEDDYLKLRKSMIKFPSKGAWNIEICGSGTRALPFCLNNQLIKILEDLGVPYSSFEKLQADEIGHLRSAVKSTSNAMRFLESSHIAKSVQLPWLIRILDGLGLQHSQDVFLRRVMQLTVLMKLRDLKYRARIPVSKAVTLYGIMDETGYLQEGEIFCSFLSDRGFREILEKKRVVITRSPALHPGDVQIVDAVDVPENSPLRRLHNCVAFSQYGRRDLPSMLSGGDLDGDLYNVIYDDTLIPPAVTSPADYPRVPAKDLERPVETADIIDFFLTFMQQDQLGRIATVHQVLADQKPTGTFDRDCLLLAELHSTAVDFSKTGVPVDMQRIPKTPRNRPDFLAPGPRVRVAEGLDMLEETAEMTVNDDDDDERPQINYYKSYNTLGLLYRNIDEADFLAEIQDAGRRSTRSMDVLQDVWKYVQDETAGFLWDHLVDPAWDIKEIYEDHLRDLMQTYSRTPWKSAITEFEVFIGTILGQNHKQSRHDKEFSKEMREEYDKLVDFTVSMIRDREAGGVEALERSIACFWIALNPSALALRARSTSTSRNRQHHYRNQEEKLLSFPWIAAITCLKEVDKFQRSMPF